MTSLHRHLAACNNTDLPGGRVPLSIDGALVGWVSPAAAEDLRRDTAGFATDGAGLALVPGDAAARSAALAAAAQRLAHAGLLRIRGEAFDVRATPEAPALAVLDRGAIPVFGVAAQGVHLNGLVRRADGLHIWVGVRAADKAVAPGKLDNLVAGGLSAGLTPMECLVKEAGEEAAIPPDLAARARPAGRLGYVMSAREGLRRDVLHVFDLDLPEDFVPVPDGDEVARFELWPAARLLEAVRCTEDVKFNVALVLIDLFLRHGFLGDPDGGLRAGLDRFR
ncbi:DUF4743 domain-containing protein [Humitalea sp. 24SJ18S-53]|uniref:NUDIX hydrolase n=1 Tax=Humitalea sp. 24SJ18S-53 TaxID=3422307 RepID=UPI003D67F66A